MHADSRRHQVAECRDDRAPTLRQEGSLVLHRYGGASPSSTTVNCRRHAVSPPPADAPDARIPGEFGDSATSKDAPRGRESTPSRQQQTRPVSRTRPGQQNPP
jgi:hypothetical protein